MDIYFMKARDERDFDEAAEKRAEARKKARRGAQYEPPKEKMTIEEEILYNEQCQRLRETHGLRPPKRND